MAVTRVWGFGVVRKRNQEEFAWTQKAFAKWDLKDLKRRGKSLNVKWRTTW